MSTHFLNAFAKSLPITFISVKSGWCRNCNFLIPTYKQIGAVMLISINWRKNKWNAFCWKESSISLKFFLNVNEVCYQIIITASGITCYLFGSNPLPEPNDEIFFTPYGVTRPHWVYTALTTSTKIANFLSHFSQHRKVMQQAIIWSNVDLSSISSPGNTSMHFQDWYWKWYFL